MMLPRFLYTCRSWEKRDSHLFFIENLVAQPGFRDHYYVDVWHVSSPEKYSLLVRLKAVVRLSTNFFMGKAAQLPAEARFGRWIEIRQRAGLQNAVRQTPQARINGGVSNIQID